MESTKKIKYKPKVQPQSNLEHKSQKTKYVQKNKSQNKESTSQRLMQPKKQQKSHYYYNKSDKKEQQHQNRGNYDQRDKLKILTVPKHIVDYSTSVNQEELGIKVETRFIRKYFLQLFMDASKEELVIRRATYFPCIFFEYWNQDRRMVDVDYKDLVRYNRERFKASPQLLSVLFNQLYERVEPKFFHLALFGIKMAKQRNIPMNNRTVFKQQNIQTELMFYYSLNKRKQINFTIIDTNLNFLYFRTEDILKLKQQFPDQYDLYQRFERVARAGKERVIGDRWDILQQEQIEFNQKDIMYIGESVDKLQGKLTQEMKTLYNNIFDSEQELKQKNNLIKQMNEEPNAEQLQRLQELQSQIKLLDKKIANSNKILKNIDMEKKYLECKHELTQWFYIKSIKKVILAGKEMTSKLPILLKKQEIMRMLRNSYNQPLIIEGETGSGKSTQLPQILIQFCGILEQPQSRPILVTQPRRLATRTLAQRVASELGEERPNNFVDYKNSLQKQVNSNAKIIFKLDRLVLDELTQDPELEKFSQKYSCLVIDEAHQRTISIDVIIGLVRKLLLKRSDFKVIITSASMDVELFQKEFKTKALKVSGRLFNVKVDYKDYEGDLNTLTKVQKVINEQILHDENSLKQKFKGHVLVFCSGVDQINKLTQIYTLKLNPSRFLIFPLHGRVAPQEQRKAFLPCKQHKLIFASRIAETAITIDDVRVVVDPGEDIQLIYDQRYKFSSMKIRPISQSSAKQRAGRAGRTATGYCFRLYSQESFYSRPLGKVPEMENSSLDTVVLRLKSLGIDDVVEFPYISKPDKEGLFSSIQNLKMIGALNGTQKITQIGDLLIVIPVEPMLSRSILEALLVEEILRENKNTNYDFLTQLEYQQNDGKIVQSIVEILSMIVNSSSLFHISEANQNQGQLNKFQQFKVDQGDFFFLRSIYRQFKQTLDDLGDRSELSFWIKKYYLSKKSLKQVKELQSQISKIILTIRKTKRLRVNELEDQIDEIKQKLRHCHSLKDIMMACLITSFIPNLCIYSEDPQIGYTLISQKRPIAIYGTSTVSLIGLTQTSPKWILSYDFYTSQRGKFYCKIAQGIDFNFIKNTVNQYAWKKFNLGQIQKINPFYEKIWENGLPTKVYFTVKNNYIRYSCGGQGAEEKELYQKSTWLFDDRANFMKIYILKDGLSAEIQQLRFKYLKYFQSIKLRFEDRDHRHPYYANTQILFDPSFQIKSIERVIQKDLLISEYTADDYPILKQFVRNKFSDLVDIDIFPYSRNIKIGVSEDKYLKSIEQQIQQFLKEAPLKQRPVIKIIPRNQRRYSQSKVLLVFYVQNKHQKYKNNDQKFFNMLKDAQDEEQNNFQLSHKTDLEWKEEVSTLLYNIKVNPETCTINIWGNYDSSYKKSQFIELCAEINSFEGGIFQKLQQLEGKKRYIGCDRLFIKRTYEQVLAFPEQKIFICLKDEYLSIIIDEKRRCKELRITERSVRMRNKHYAKIICKSTNREALMRLAQRIHNLFDPKIIELTDQECRYLMEIDQRSILDKIEHQYKYSIVFELNRLTKSLTVFCPLIDFKEIVDKIKEHMKKSDYVTNRVSYKGKNLNQIVSTINLFAESLLKDNVKLEYQILFNRKMINITTLPKRFLELKTQIEAISSPIGADCQLCMGKVNSPYVLLNCQHSFCKICLLGFLKGQLNCQDGSISCPQAECSFEISMFDIELILGQYLFERTADEKVRKYVEQNSQFRMCPRCSLILDVDEGCSSFQCDTCGYLKADKNPKSGHQQLNFDGDDE